MRSQFVQTVEKILHNDVTTTLLLGDIGVWGFRNAFKDFPNRVYNIGILEQSTVGLAAGLALSGLTPIVHTIAPFLVERAFEQLKIDFGYQSLGGNFVSVGASYDYAALGCTHHCPGDVEVLLQIPEFEIVVPGTKAEFDLLFSRSYANGKPTYFRLSENNNSQTVTKKFGKAELIRKGSKATIIVVGPLLDQVQEAVMNEDVNLIYYSTLRPFDGDVLKKLSGIEKILLVEPYYQGGLLESIQTALFPRPLAIDCLGVPRRFLRNYGRSVDHDKQIGFTPENIHKRLRLLIDA